jgi:hypothetical protein
MTDQSDCTFNLLSLLFPGDGLTADEFVRECLSLGLIAKIEAEELTVTGKTKTGWIYSDTFRMPPYEDGTYESGVISVLRTWKQQKEVEHRG